ncbi:unnamed protein product [Kuraishia capsulata CBS 1993]|uniref:Mitochondrial carrier protein n=1 Tax=Kuraishia capsulata CBS 1993 TaxID=1382522 RepID=W6MKE6_9ASCO|nr:uncharacterized protein KUCA_T00002440001 [Kuraishia capsulata CBS 1993]CDK26468.1 unnamed protein product [Kuraishia capsulata CBS 1993]
MADIVVKELRHPSSYLSSDEIVPISGAISGFIAGVAVCPLDVAKTRLQAQGSFLQKHPDGLRNFEKFRYKGLGGTLRTILKQEGIKGLYRGLPAMVLGYFPTWMIYFTVYEQNKKLTRNLFDHETLSFATSAILAGAVSTTLTNPIWVVKTRMMIQTGDGRTIYDRFPSKHQTGASKDAQVYKSLVDTFVKMYRKEGWKSFYSGLLPSYIGLTHVAIQFPIYENLKKNLNLRDDSSNVGKLTLASIISKVLASSVTYPHEILRTRLQIDKTKVSMMTGLVRTFLSVYKNEGVKGFYSGFIINLTRTVPSSAVTLVTFEYIKGYLERVNGL